MELLKNMNVLTIVYMFCINMHSFFLCDSIKPVGFNSEFILPISWLLVSNIFIMKKKSDPNKIE